ncbi:hypothetical protein NKH98_23495 [Mesorhizobium sp. M0833]|uniref:hypothetical protein n=1 Tax=unclassified Mesorhizobium TaxID=325217 RepID=UPI00333CFF57
MERFRAAVIPIYGLPTEIIVPMVRKPRHGACRRFVRFRIRRPANGRYFEFSFAPRRPVQSQLHRVAGLKIAKLRVHATSAFSSRLAPFNPGERENAGVHSDYNLPELQANGGCINIRRCEST